jgi:hypothetical protein
VTGTPISKVRGDIPRLPAGGLENRSAELFIKATRGRLRGSSDSAADDFSVKVFFGRAWLTLPGTV